MMIIKLQNATKSVAIIFLAGLVGACSNTSLDSMLDDLELPKFGNRDDGSTELLMPPGLYAPIRQERYDVPGSAASMKAASLSDYVLPQRLDMRLRREHNTVWLAVDTNPVQLWPHIKSFWTGYGFRIDNENPTYGSLETNWLEQSLGPGSNMRIQDKFITRLVRDSDAVTHIYIVNRKNMYADGRMNLAFSDTETETNMLYDLMAYLANLKGDPAELPSLEETQLMLDIRNNEGVPVLTIGHSYSHVWRLLGVALERAGVEVVNADRSRRIYLVRYDRSGQSDSTGDEAYFDGDLIQLHLLPSTDKTLITAHLHRSNNRPLPYEVAHNILQRIVTAY